MSEEIFDPVIVSINEKLAHLSPQLPNGGFSNTENPVIAGFGFGGDCYCVPKKVKIGLLCGYFSWKDAMYSEKLRYLQLFLRRTNETSLDRYVMAMRKSVERARACYGEELEMFLIVDRIVEMMLLDSCFIIELFRKDAMKELRGTDDPIFKTGRDLPALRHDLLLIGNQLPFPILVEFFNMSKIQDNPQDNLIDLALKFFGISLPDTSRGSLEFQINRFNHLLHMVHYSLCPPLLVTKVCGEPSEIETECEFINYATDLQEGGVKFKKIKGQNLLDINFTNGTMKIPPLKFADSTLLLLENLVEYEKKLPVSDTKYVSDYVKFMQCLVNSPKDVELLRRKEIIENWYGSDKKIFDELNRLGDVAVISQAFAYSEILKKVNGHCRHRRNVWMANLWTSYFNSPWAFISFVAAVILLLLTLTQTVFAILSYHP